LAFAVLFALAALDAAGYSIIAPVVPEIGDATGAGPGLMGVLVASFAVGQMVGYPLSARLLQRVNARAVLLDATIVRAVLLPSTMKLLGERNWYLPSFLGWLPRASIEAPPARDPV